VRSWPPWPPPCGCCRLGTALAVGALVGSVAYSALFLLLSLVTRRPVLLGLVYVLIWEGLLGNLVRGTRILSVEQYVGTVADRIAPTSYLPATVSLPTALIMAAAFTVVGTVLAVNQLRAFSVTGETS
jgi:ABC-2 type transport system permease protein